MPDKSDQKSKKTKLRSPNYPAIDLQDAIEKARELYQAEKRNAANVSVVAQHWKYSSETSGSFMLALAAVKAFGLIDDSGSGSGRQIKLSDLALRILLDTRQDSPERVAAIKDAALRPRMHQELWNKWRTVLPSDENLRHELVFTHRFNENTVNKFIEEYKKTIQFAKLADSDKVGAEVQNNGGSPGGDRPLKVGDFVQWEAGGVLQFPTPRKLSQISPDGKFAFAEGSYTGMPIEQVSRVDAPTNPQPEYTPSPLKTTMQEFVVPLSEGRAVFQWPTELNEADVDDLKDSLKILERKIARSTAAPKGKTDEK